MSDPRAAELSADDVDLAFSDEALGFTTTDGLEPLDRIVGQPRALRALELGLGIDHASYNIYVAGMSGMGKKRMIHRALSERVDDAPTPPDWIYVNNFDEPDRPVAVDLPAGEGLRLRKQVREMVARMRDELPKALQDEELSREKQRLGQRYQERGRKLHEEVEQKATEHGLSVRPGPEGHIMLVPMRGDRPMTDEEIEQLDERDEEHIRHHQREVAQHVSSMLSRQQELRHELAKEIGRVERAFAERFMEPLFKPLLDTYEHETLRQWLHAMKQHMLDHLERFERQEGGSQQQQLMRLMGQANGETGWREYDVNLLVDHSNTVGAPVVVEDSPNYKNLFGMIDRQVDRTGRVTTGFTHIKAGSLLRAAGGFLVLNLKDALIEPVVWKELKRAIKSGTLRIQDYEPFGMFATSALKPEPIPLRTKLVVVGEPLVYHMLTLLDEDFRDIFKVKAEFNPEMQRNQDSGVIIGRMIQRLKADGERLLPFDAAGIAELMRVSARLVSDRRKLTAELSRLADVAREASYWAQQENAGHASAQHVRKAQEERIFRSDLVACKIRELIEDGSLRVDVEGKASGQVNGLAVIDLGDYAFGRPSRVTAAVGIGTAGIINIERESKLSGRTYDKAMLILEGYLRGTYGSTQPLAMSASLAMEQSYGMIDGDSASAAELMCLLGALSDSTLRQDVAVTGSVNQWGEVQAVGGVNEKIEGFFDVCTEVGLSGSQGVLIPQSNRKNLVLRPDVVDAVREGRFHVWSFDHIDEGLALLCEQPASEIHRGCGTRLHELAEQIKQQQVASDGQAGRAMSPDGSGPGDPRPPLPGRNP